MRALFDQILNMSLAGSCGIAFVLAAGQAAGVAFGKGSTRARIRNVLRYQRPRLLVSLTGATVVILLACGLLTDPIQSIELPKHNGLYEVQEITSQWTFSEVFRPDPGQMGQYLISDGSLFHISRDNCTLRGELREIQLTEDTFFSLFDFNTRMGEAGQRQLLEENQNAWQIEQPTTFQLLLLQKDGTLYLLNGYNKTKVGPDETAPRIHWVFQLAPLEITTAQPPAGNYRVSQLLYDAPSFNFTYSLETAPTYQIASSGLVTASGNMAGNPILGMPQPLTLTPQNFDALFFYDAGGAVPDAIQSIRTSAAQAWGMKNGDELHYLITGSNGTLLLASGYLEDDSPALIRWIFALEPV